MAEFTYNNVKNTSTSHTSFELNYGYHPRTSYKENVHTRTQSKSADELATNLREMIAIYIKNF